MHPSKRKGDSGLLMPNKRFKYTGDPEELESHYEKLQEKYLKEGLSQETQLLLRRISISTCVPNDLKQSPLLRILSEICKDLLMSELEITLWALMIEKAGLVETTFQISMHLLYSAYTAKVYLNEDTKVIDHYLCSKYSDFVSKYRSWLETYQSKFSIDPKELNSKFFVLSKPPAVQESQLINYNYYVDDILQVMPPATFGEMNEDFFAKRGHKKHKKPKKKDPAEELSPSQLLAGEENSFSPSSSPKF